MREPILLVLAIFCSLWAGCRSPAAPNDSVADEDPQSKFENIGPGGDVEFVGSEACAGCHEAEYHGYQSHGMANSVYALSDSTAEAEYPSKSFYDERAVTTEAPDSIDYTIVNPAHLSLDRRMDVCQQCHLNGTVSLLRKGRGPFEFRPGEPVSAHVSIFSRPEPDTSAHEIAVISHADRLKKSACFVGSRESERPMDCMTCHDAHEGFRSAGPQYFSETCQNCHSGASFRSRFSESGIRRVHVREASTGKKRFPYAGTADPAGDGALR